MTGINHALTGAVIGVGIGQPVLAIPLAFVSHFVLDALPHFGQKYENRSRIFRVVVGADIILLIGLFTYLATQSQWLGVVAAVAAMSPDFAWIYRFTVKERFGRLPMSPLNAFNQFHVDVQKLESRAGIVSELIWALAAAVILWNLL